MKTKLHVAQFCNQHCTTALQKSPSINIFRYCFASNRNRGRGWLKLDLRVNEIQLRASALSLWGGDVCIFVRCEAYREIIRGGGGDIHEGLNFSRCQIDGILLARKKVCGGLKADADNGDATKRMRKHSSGGCGN